MSKQLPRVSDLAEFHEDYFLARKAVVVTGAARAIPASRWTLAHLADVLSDQRPTVRIANGRLARMAMRDFFRYLASPESVTSSHGPVYLTDFYLNPTFGDARRATLARDIQYPLVPEDERQDWRANHPGWNTLYAGAAGTRTRLHQDPFSMSSWLAEISGTKLWRLCEPDAVSEEVGFKTDPFIDGPLPCEFFEAVLEPGDVIYIPPDWWHAVQNPTTTIALTGNFCTLAHARASFEEVKARAASSEKDVWMKTWAAVLGEGSPESAPNIAS